MPFLRTSFVALLVVCAANTSRSLESARDQYKANEDVPHPPQLLSEATDQAVDVRQLFKIKPNDDIQNDKITENSNKLEPSSAKKEKRAIQFAGFNIRTNYYSTWNPAVSSIIPVPPLSSFSIFQPQYYQLSRPYVIPVWGSPGKLPFYFPPQPLYINPGYPVHNPPKGYLPPSGYLPPGKNESTPAPPTEDTTVPTMNRFPDEPPVWDKVSAPPVPTRRPRPPGQRTTTPPPLVHNAEDVAVSMQRPSTPGRQPVQPPPQELAPPPTQQQGRPGGRQPSRCVWAIISCCSTSSKDISYSCFEQLGCTGAFWDNSPCDSEFAKAAIANVINYYETQ